MRLFASVALVMTFIASAGVRPRTGGGEVGGGGSGDMPVFNAGTDTLVWEDDFDAAPTIQEMWDDRNEGGFWPQADPPGIPESIITPGYNGSSQALRMSYPGGSEQFACDWNQGVQGSAVGTAATIHVFEYYARIIFSSPLDPDTDTLGVKWVMIRHPTGDRIQWSSHNAQSSLTCAFTEEGPPLSVWSVFDQSHLTDCNAWAPIGPRLEEIDDGNWHHYVHRYKSNSASMARDGFAQMWVDGAKVIDCSLAAVGVVPDGALNDKPYCALDDVDGLANNTTSAEVTFGSVQTTDTPAWTFDIGYFRRWREAGT